MKMTVNKGDPQFSMGISHIYIVLTLSDVRNGEDIQKPTLMPATELTD